MYRFRDEIARTSGLDMIIHVNPESEEKNINPFDHGSELHTHVTKTEGLIQALEKYQIDVAIGGARRDEEKSRAKERVFSIRSSTHRWDSKRQRPELWNLYNGYKDKGESIRAVGGRVAGFPVTGYPGVFRPGEKVGIKVSVGPR